MATQTRRSPLAAMRSRLGGRWPWVAITTAILVLGVAVLDGAIRGPTDPPVIRTWGATGRSWPTQPWRLVTATVLTSGPRMTAGMVIVVLFVGIVVEHRMRTRTAWLAAIGGTLAATILCDLALSAMSRLGSASAERTLSTPDFGPSALAAGLAGAGAVRMPRRWALVVAALMLNGVVLHHQLPDAEHLVAFAFGWAVGAAE